MKYVNPLSDNERILLSRLYKLDKKIGNFMEHHPNESMNKLIPKTDFIVKCNQIYNLMSKDLIKISLQRTKYTDKLVDIKKYIND